MKVIEYISESLFGWRKDSFLKKVTTAGVILLGGCLICRYDYERTNVEKAVTSILERKCEHTFFMPINKAKCGENTYVYNPETGELSRDS